MTCSRKIACLRSSVCGRVLRPALIEQDGLRRELPRRGEHDSAVRQIVRADVVARGDVVVGQLGHRLGRRVVLVDLPVRLLEVRIGLSFGFSGRRSENTIFVPSGDTSRSRTSPMPLVIDCGDVGLGAAGAGRARGCTDRRP